MVEGVSGFTGGRAAIKLFCCHSPKDRELYAELQSHLTSLVRNGWVDAGSATGCVEDAKRLEAAGAVALNFTNSGPVVGPAVVKAVSIPVLGGFGGGPWLDGRIRMATAAIGYSADNVDRDPDTYANVGRDAGARVRDDRRRLRRQALPDQLDQADQPPGAEEAQGSHGATGRRAGPLRAPGADAAGGRRIQPPRLPSA